MLTQKERLTERVSELLGQVTKVKRPFGYQMSQSIEIAAKTYRSNDKKLDDGDESDGVRVRGKSIKKQKKGGEE